uniref:Uncharacterized protein n=1 Tax=Aegilops tauschii subsp. strangulata TaxID=200361 RepID=A0A452ZYK4_AEGTS
IGMPEMPRGTCSAALTGHHVRPTVHTATVHRAAASLISKDGSQDKSHRHAPSQTLSPASLPHPTAAPQNGSVLHYWCPAPLLLFLPHHSPNTNHSAASSR